MIGKTSSLIKNQLALCSFAEKLTLNPGKITELDYQSLKEIDLNDKRYLKLYKLFLILIT